MSEAAHNPLTPAQKEALLKAWDSLARDMDAEAIVASLMEQLHGLPPAQRTERFYELLGLCLSTLSENGIADVRSHIAALPQELPLISGTLDLIDGHLALRAIGNPPTQQP